MNLDLAQSRNSEEEPRSSDSHTDADGQASVSVIHFRVVAPLVVIIPPQVHLAAGSSGGFEAMVLCAVSTRQPHNPPTPSEILLPPQGSEKK